MFVLHQGRHATTDEITACAYQAVNVDNKYNGAPVQVRVVMGKEPRHFLAIFKGKLIIFEVRLFTPRSTFCCITIVQIQNRPVSSLCVYVSEGWSPYSCNTRRKMQISARMLCLCLCVSSGWYRPSQCGEPGQGCQALPGERKR